ncbi:MAG: hypothetical protein AB8H79_23170 [Myxococcota bacterium]
MKPAILLSMLGLVLLIPITVMALMDVGYLGIWAVGLNGWASAQVLVDLVLSCLVALFYVVPDARRRGVWAWPLVVLTVLLGSLALMMWMVVRGRWPATAAASIP